METLEGILRLTWKSLNERYRLEEKLHIEEDEFIDNLLRKNPEKDARPMRKPEGPR